jgi:hypothetical protein
VRRQRAYCTRFSRHRPRTGSSQDGLWAPGSLEAMILGIELCYREALWGIRCDHGHLMVVMEI